MTELFDLVASWPTFGLIVLVFGFTPGFVPRLILLLYPGDDARRKEFVAELYSVPRPMRPIWGAEQIETALWEGPGARLRARRKRAEERRRGKAPRERPAAAALVQEGDGQVYDVEPVDLRPPPPTELDRLVRYLGDNPSALPKAKALGSKASCRTRTPPSTLDLRT